MNSLQFCYGVFEGNVRGAHKQCCACISEGKLVRQRHGHFHSLRIHSEMEQNKPGLWEA